MKRMGRMRGVRAFVRWMAVVALVVAAGLCAMCTVGGADVDGDDDNDDDAQPELGPGRSVGLKVRPFYMGATGFQIDFGDPFPVFDSAYLDGLIDMASVHQDFYGIPWIEFAAGSEPPGAWVEKMEGLKRFADELDLPVFLSVTPLGSPERYKLAPLAFEDESGSLATLSDWKPSCPDLLADPDGPALMQAYKNYVLWMVDFFEPRFVNIAVEINLFYHFCGAGPFVGIIDMVNAVYDAIKDEHPELPVMESFQIDFLWGYDGECKADHLTCLEQNLEAMSAFKYDMFGMSSYILDNVNQLGYIPDDLFSAIAERVDAPLAVAETGYNSASVVLEIPHGSGDCYEVLSSSHEEQREYLEFLLTEAERLKMPLVVWWSVRDYLPPALEGTCPCPADEEPLWCAALNSFDVDTELMLRFFGHMGIIYQDGSEKSACELWNEWFRRPLEPGLQAAASASGSCGRRLLHPSRQRNDY